jgi:hypothetical protein
MGLATALKYRSFSPRYDGAVIATNLVRQLTICIFPRWQLARLASVACQRHASLARAGRGSGREERSQAPTRAA